MKLADRIRKQAETMTDVEIQAMADNAETPAAKAAWDAEERRRWAGYSADNWFKAGVWLNGWPGQ